MGFWIIAENEITLFVLLHILTLFMIFKAVKQLTEVKKPTLGYNYITVA